MTALLQLIIKVVSQIYHSEDKIISRGNRFFQFSITATRTAIISPLPIARLFHFSVFNLDNLSFFFSLPPSLRQLQSRGLYLFLILFLRLSLIDLKRTKISYVVAVTDSCFSLFKNNDFVGNSIPPQHNLTSPPPHSHLCYRFSNHIFYRNLKLLRLFRI